MSDFVKRTFRAQLTMSMNSLLSRAVLDIMTIFENSLNDQQLELAQKAEEVAQLKIKLQTAELRLLEGEHVSDRGAEVKKQALKAPEQTCNVPEGDYEEPADWCAPLGSETPKKQDDGFCPSVRLRRLSIPLWPITIKTEGDTYNIGLKRQTMSLRSSKQGPSSTKRLTAEVQGSPYIPVRNGMKKFLQDIKQEFTEQKDGTGHRRSTRNSTGTTEEPNGMSKSPERKMAETEPEENEMEEHEKGYSCTYCDKEFDTTFGRNMHLRIMHKQCKGCRKQFPFPSMLERHKPYCNKLKKKKKKKNKALSTYPPKPDSCEEETPTAPKTEQGIVEGDGTGSSGNHDSSIEKDASTKGHACVRCNRVFRRAWRLREHMLVHTGEKRFHCSKCSKKFYHSHSLKMHMIKKHKNLIGFSETNHNYMWTKPIEEAEEIAEDLTSPNQDQRQAVDHNGVDGWQTMDTLCPETKSKPFLIEHLYTRTGNGPLKCPRCLATFTFHRQLNKHRKKCPIVRKKCDKCDKKFSKLAWYMKHVSKCHNDAPN